MKRPLYLEIVVARLFHAIFCSSPEQFAAACASLRNSVVPTSAPSASPRLVVARTRKKLCDSPPLLSLRSLKTKKRFASNSPILHLFTAKTDSFPSLHVLHVFCTFYTLLHFVVLKILHKKGSCGLTIRIFSIHMVNDFSHNFAKMFENIFSEKA